MKFSVQQSVLYSALQTVNRAVPTKPTHPILISIRIEVEREQITLTGFDLSFGIEVKITEFNLYETGDVCLPAKLLLNIVSKQDSSEEIIVSTDENNFCTLSVGNSEYQIVGVSSEEYPELSSVVDSGSEMNDDDYQEFILSPVDLLTSIKNTLFACSSDESKQVLTGLNFEISSECLKVAATDGHRLAVTSVTFNELLQLDDSQKAIITIPAKILKELERVLTGSKSESIKLVGGNGCFIFETESTKLVCRMLDGKYPNYPQLIPTEGQFSTHITIDRKALIKSIDKVSAILDNPRSDLISINIDTDNQQITLSTQTKDVGKCFELITAQISGDLDRICFNAGYLMEGLKVMDCTEVQIKLTTKTNPCIIAPLTNLDMIYLIMPIQMRG